MAFKLSESFLDQYKNLQPNWGPLGEFVYLRTYSRKIEGENRNEKWWETVRRVVEGTYNIQREHCDTLKLAWNATKAKKSAEKMYEKIFNFKFLPPGRGLWMMGSDFVKQRGSAALNNCAMISTADIDVRGSFAFTWTMDALMLGVGVGFDTKGANKITIKQPKPDGTFIIPDSREGWVESLGMLLDGYFHGKAIPTFDYSLIRPYGSPIHGFGGVASGPEPLIKLHNSLHVLLSEKINSKLASTDIVDIVNMISTCVVAGNVRRSACIAIGDITDKAYTTMKDYKLYPEQVASHRWASNNSVFAEVGKTDYSSIVDSIALNGEPGIVWLENVQKYSRMIDPPDWLDKEAVGVNPCQPSWAKVLTPDGLRKFEDIGIGSLIWSKEGWTKVINKWGTGVKPVYKYTTTAGIFYGTENHRVISGGTKIEAKDASSIEILTGPFRSNITINPQDIMDGLVLGDGSVHKASNDLVYLIIGNKDTDYFTSEVASLITKARPGLKEGAYEVNTTLTANEVPKTFERKIPERFMKDFNTMAGFLRGLFSANGSVVGNRITLKASSKQIIEDAQMMLSALGIRSYYTTNNPHAVKFSNGTYDCKQSYDLNITIDREKFVKIIGFIQGYKNDTVKITEGYARKTDYDIISVDLVSEESVYDITVDNESHTYWTQGCNVSNCSEQSLENAELCCLVETFPSLHESYAEYKETLKYAYLYGKTVTLLSTHWPETNAILLKNRRIGVSQSGIQDAFVKHGRRNMLEWCNESYGYLRALDTKYSNWLCIPKSKKITSVKPSGTVSLLPGVSAGIHRPHSEYYIRRVRVAKSNPIATVMLVAGYPVEDDVVDPSTSVINFPVYERYFSEKKSDASIWQQVKDVVDYQRWWADNNVSVTVTFKADEKKDIPKLLQAYEDSLKTISFLPLVDHGYKQAPYEEITKEQYEEMASKIAKPDFSCITSTPLGSKFCDGESCSLG